MDKRDQPSIFKSHPELQPQSFLDDEVSKESLEKNPTTPFEGLRTRQLPEGIKTRKQMTQEIERFMKQRDQMAGLDGESSSASRMFRPKSVPAYFQKPRRTLYDEVRQNRDFYEELAHQLHKDSDEYILFVKNSIEEQPQKSTRISTPQKNRSISLRGIMDEEARSLKHQKMKHFSLFPEE